MNEHQAQTSRSGRGPIRCSASHGSGFTGVPWPVVQRPRATDRHRQAIQRQQQRPLSGLRESDEASRLDQSRDDYQGSSGIAGCGSSLHYPARLQAQSRNVAGLDVAWIGLDARHGNCAQWIHARRLPAKKILTLRKWGRGGIDSPRKRGRGIAHYPKKWGYQRIFSNLATPFFGEYLEVAICTGIGGAHR